METYKFVFVSLISLGLILGVAESFDYHEKELESEEGLKGMYQRWQEHHNIKENRPERFNVFKYNVENIHKKNKMNKPYKLEVNKFATLTHHEFTNTYTGNLNHYRALNGIKSDSFKEDNSLKDGNLEGCWKLWNMTKLPQQIDWRELGAVGPIKNQGACGSCWAFSAVVGIEGVNAIVTGKYVALSEQEIMDCDTQGGCNGGFPQNVYDFVRDHGGLCTAEFYPYTGTPGTCDDTKFGHHAATLGGHDEKMPKDELSVTKAVATQPTPVGLEASEEFMFYKEGIFTGPCSPRDKVNHAVAIVGYGQTAEGLRYWIVRNSWGGDWGDGGYIRIARETGCAEGILGINTDPSLPIKDPNVPNNEL